MLKLLIKKQLGEVFKGYFYDSKKNKMRSKGAIIAYFIFFIVVMVGLLGGTFAFLSLSLCGPLTAVGMGWMYFLLMCGIAILLGAFGSVFNSYAALYMAKDNDQLLCLPIPLRTIIAARLSNVYLMGAMYSATVLIPALIVYWIVAGATVSNVICGVILLLVVTLIVMLLSCVLGWVVAKISVRLKNKSFITVLVSLLFIGAYYFFYFKANLFIQNLVQNADAYGEKLRGSAYGLYLFGRIGEGDWMAAAIFLVVTAALVVLVWRLLSRSFLSVATAGSSTAKVRYTEKEAKQKTAFGALLSKEFSRFTSSANYMLNCGLGVLLIPIVGVTLLIKGGYVVDLLGTALASRPGSAAILLCTSLIMLAAMNIMAAPSVSLEGKSLWIPQSLPVEPKTVLRAKLSVQLILSLIPMLFAGVCAAIVLKDSPAVRVLACLLPPVYAAFSAVLDLSAGLRMPILNWTNEIAPIKQSGAVSLALFGGWAIGVAFAGLYMLIGYKMGAAAYMAIWLVLFVVLGLLMQRRLDTKGAAEFAAL